MYVQSIAQATEWKFDCPAKRKTVCNKTCHRHTESLTQTTLHQPWAKLSLLDDRFTGKDRFTDNVSLTDAFALVDTLFSAAHCRCQNFQWPSSWSCHICQKPVLVFMVKLVQKMQLLEVQVQVRRWGCWLAASRSQTAQTPGLLGSGISRDCLSKTKDFCCCVAVAIMEQAD